MESYRTNIDVRLPNREGVEMLIKALKRYDPTDYFSLDKFTINWTLSATEDDKIEIVFHSTIECITEEMIRIRLCNSVLNDFIRLINYIKLVTWHALSIPKLQKTTIIIGNISIHESIACWHVDFELPLFDVNDAMSLLINEAKVGNADFSSCCLIFNTINSDWVIGESATGENDCEFKEHDRLPEIHTVGDYLSLIKRIENFNPTACAPNGLLFRGQARDTFMLMPSIMRTLTLQSDADLFPYFSYKSFNPEEEILSEFVQQACATITHIDTSDIKRWTEYAQHYGVPTRLLDFSTNPLVALYFACLEEYSHEDSVVWCINRVAYNFFLQKNSEHVINKYKDKKVGIYSELIECVIPTDDLVEDIYNYEKCDGFESVNMNNEEALAHFFEARETKYNMKEPVFYFPPYFSPRMAAQSSVFLIWGSIFEAFESFFDHDNFMSISTFDDNLTSERFAYKVFIAQDCRKDILRELDRMGINYKTLFPGLDGIGNYFIQKYKNTNGNYEETIRPNVLNKYKYKNDV